MDDLDVTNELKKVISEEELEINRLVEGSKSFKKQASELQNKIEKLAVRNLRSRKQQLQRFNRILIKAAQISIAAKSK
uniref:Uncharacterized protein n=1 Tax=Kalanchoe fedtschenkoi TaxID=63787 RepID=A0A7N0VCX0_KALFE